MINLQRLEGASMIMISVPQRWTRNVCLFELTDGLRSVTEMMLEVRNLRPVAECTEVLEVSRTGIETLRYKTGRPTLGFPEETPAWMHVCEINNSLCTIFLHEKQELKHAIAAVGHDAGLFRPVFQALHGGEVATEGQAADAGVPASDAG